MNAINTGTTTLGTPNPEPSANQVCCINNTYHTQPKTRQVQTVALDSKIISWKINLKNLKNILTKFIFFAGISRLRWNSFWETSAQSYWKNFYWGKQNALQRCYVWAEKFEKSIVHATNIVYMRCNSIVQFNSLSSLSCTNRRWRRLILVPKFWYL